MIIRTRVDTSGLTEFEKRFLFQEAPEDGEETPRRNVKRIQLKAADRRRRDDTKNAAIEGPVEMEEELPEEPETDASDAPTTEEESVEDPQANADTGEEDVDDDDIAIDDSDDLGNMDDMSEEDTVDETGDEEAGNEGEDGDIVLDDSDTTPDDADEDGGDSDTTTDDTEGGNNGESQQDQDEIMHKQNLYRKFMNLHDSINNQCQKLDTRIGVDDATNLQYKEVTNKLRKLKEFLYTYMIIKFTHEEYEQSLLFYERALAAANLGLSSLAEIRKKEEKQVAKN